jgi:hypothetical protein
MRQTNELVGSNSVKSRFNSHFNTTIVIRLIGFSVSTGFMVWVLLIIMLRDSRLPLILNVVHSAHNLSNFEPHSPYLNYIVQFESDGWKAELTCPILRNNLPKLLLRILGVIKSLIYKLGLVDPQLFVQVNDACKRFVSFAVLCCNCIILGAIKGAISSIYFNLVM